MYNRRLHCFLPHPQQRALHSWVSPGESLKQTHERRTLLCLKLSSEDLSSQMGFSISCPSDILLFERRLTVRE